MPILETLIKVITFKILKQQDHVDKFRSGTFSAHDVSALRLEQDISTFDILEHVDLKLLIATGSGQRGSGQRGSAQRYLVSDLS